MLPFPNQQNQIINKLSNNNKTERGKKWILFISVASFSIFKKYDLNKDEVFFLISVCISPLTIFGYSSHNNFYEPWQYSFYLLMLYSLRFFVRDEG